MREPPAETLRAGHETTDASAIGLAAFGIGLAIGAIVMQLILSHFFRGMKAELATQAPGSEAPSLIAQRPSLPLFPPPRLQVDSASDLERYLRRENELLGSYGWVDRKAGIARIPIQSAMERLAHGH